MIIRKPYPNELESTLIVLEYQRDEQGIDLDSDHLAQTVKQHMTRATHLWINAYQGTRPVGCIGGCLAEDNWTGDRFAMINFFYVLESHRDQGIYAKLLEEFTAWAKNNQATTVVGGDINVDYTHVFEGLGFKKQSIFVKE